jgi:hypothetical protein
VKLPVLREGVIRNFSQTLNRGGPQRDVDNFNEMMMDLAQENPLLSQFVVAWCRHFGLQGANFHQTAGLALACYKMLSIQAEANEIRALEERMI